MRNEVRSIGIVGAGVSGLIAAKTFLEEGFDCEVFERNGSLGGVWEAGYHSLRLQLPKESYEFLDWPMPGSYPRYPSCDQIVSYLNSYARHFRVYKKIHFNCSVTALQPHDGDDGWTLTYADKHEDTEVQREFDQIVVCNGLYSRPHLPVFPNQQDFAGRAMHSSEFKDFQFNRDTRVVVVGFGKSALDRAEEAAQQTSDVTLLFRQAHWPVPQEFLGVLPSKYMISRALTALLPLYLRPSTFESKLHKYAPWLVSIFWRAIEWVLRLQFRLRLGGVLPKGSVERDLFTGDFIASPNIYRLINSGDIRPLQDEIEKFTENGLELKSGKHLIADVVVFGTGWAYDQDILPPAIRSEMDDDGLYLYRHILHPNVPGFAFVGLASTFNNSLSAYLEARWLVAKLKGDLSLPSTVEMSKEIDRLKSWKRKIMPHQASRGSLLQLHMLHYHDELLGDLQISHKRKRNPIAELFGAYLPRDYKDIPSLYLRRPQLPARPVERTLASSSADDGPRTVEPLEQQLRDGEDLRGKNLDGVDLSEQSLQAADLRHASLRDCNMRNADLAAADFSGADLSSAELFNADFTGAVMSRVNLERAFLIDATMSLAYLNGANLTGAHLSGANMTGVRLNNARLVNADLSNTKLVDADLRGANLSYCDLSYANLSGADLTGAKLDGATLLSADFSGADVTNVQFNEKEACKDIRIETANGNALFKRFVQDQAYVEEYAINHQLRYLLWKFSSNCGRSLSLWLFWCVFIAVSFSLVFHFHLGGSESFVLTHLARDPGSDSHGWAPMFYYSVVTFTTLGFGDIVPSTQQAAWWIMAEVVMGYFMLGGLITILATKLARRS